MANREIKPPESDLGISTGGREALANFMAMKNLLDDRKKGGGLLSGGRTRRQMRNDMKMYQFMRQVDDQAARAADARRLQVSAADAAWNTANYLKGVGAGTGQGQTDENGNVVLMNSVNDVFGPITVPNKNVLPDQFTAKSSLGSVFAGTNPVRPEGPSPEEPPGETPGGETPGGETPIPQGKASKPTVPYLEEVNNVTSLKRKSAGQRSKNIREQQDSFFESMLIPKDENNPEGLSPEEIEQYRKEYYENLPEGDDLRQMSADYAGDVLYPLTEEKAAGQKTTAAYKKAKAEGILLPRSEVKKMKGFKAEDSGDIASAVGNTPYIPSVGDSGEIDTGNGPRPQPTGENGVIQGPQFNQ